MAQTPKKAAPIQEASPNQITVTSVTLTPEDVDSVAKSFAMRAGGLLLMAMAERGISEKQLADMLNVPSRSVRTQLMGEGWRHYLPIAALTLALGVKMDMRFVPNERE